MTVVRVYFSKYESEFQWVSTIDLAEKTLVFTCYDAPYQIQNLYVINVAKMGSFAYQFQSAIDYILYNFDEKYSFVFLGVGDILVSDIHVSKGIGVNRLKETTRVNTVLNFLLDRRRPALTFNIESEFKRIGFIIGFLGAYTWSYDALSFAKANFSPNNSIWFVARYLKNLSRTGEVALTTGNHVIRKVEEDKVIGTASRFDIINRYNLCAELLNIVGGDAHSFIVPKLQLLKYRLKLLFKYRILIRRNIQ